MINHEDDRTDVNIELPEGKNVIITWDRKIGLDSRIRSGNTLGMYQEAGDPEAKKIRFKAPVSGKIIFLAPAGQEISPLKVALIDNCKHDITLKDMCTLCGAEVKESTNSQVGYLHKDFAVSHRKAGELYKELESQALKTHKLFLILDLDNTLIHAEPTQMGRRNEKVELAFDPEKEGLDILNVSYYDKFVVKQRPYLKEFLANLSLKYQIYVYTKGTRPYAEQVLRLMDPKLIYVSVERLISRDEMGQNEFKSLNKIIHDGSMALILDDRSDVWGEIKNHVYTQAFNYFEGVGQAKLSIGRRSDVFLYMARELLEFVHEIFYELYEKGHKTRAYEIYHTIKASLFAKEHIAFVGIFKTEEELQASREFQSLRKLGAADIQLEPNKETTLIFSRYSKSITYPTGEVPVVSLWYIYYCEMYCIHLNPKEFDLRADNPLIVNLEKSIRKKGPEKDAAKDQMEDYFVTAGSSKGGLACIKDTVIRKLEDKLAGKNNKNEKDKHERPIDIKEDEEAGDVIVKKLKTEGNEGIVVKENASFVEGFLEEMNGEVKEDKGMEEEPEKKDDNENIVSTHLLDLVEEEDSDDFEDF